MSVLLALQGAAGIVVTVPAPATAQVAGVPPVVTLTVPATLATVTESAPNPDVRWIVSPATISVTTTALVPSITFTALPSSATVSGEAQAPEVALIVLTGLAGAQGELLVPTVTIGGPPITVTAVEALATAELLVPAISIGTLPIPPTPTPVDVGGGGSYMDWLESQYRSKPVVRTKPIKVEPPRRSKKRKRARLLALLDD